MFETIDEQERFCKEYNITVERFQESRFTWMELEQICNDYEAKSKKNEYEKIVQHELHVLQQCSHIHSLSYRVKDSEHLIEKLIRKNVDYLEKGESLSLNNYDKQLTDLLGIRALLLFKEDWDGVDRFLQETYKGRIKQRFVYVRPGDDCSFYENKIEILEKDAYRAIHYVIELENQPYLEIQVRTLYEEAWSEVDHKLRYPYNMKNAMMTAYINMMNRITGMADEMGSFINNYMKIFNNSVQEGIVDDNEVYQYILEEIEKCDDEILKESIKNKIYCAKDYKELQNISELLEKYMENI